MASSKDPRGQQQTTYFVQDKKNPDEIARLQIQDKMITRGMGGVLAEQSNPTIFHAVLDVACGTGGWLIETAKAYPAIQRLVGVDANNIMLDVAHAQAKKEHVNERVEFLAMDALRMLEFSDNTFDLVNMRFGVSFVRTWDWAKLFQEFRRVTKTNGIIRVTDAQAIFDSSSPAFNWLSRLMIDASYRSGNFFESERDGITAHLAPLFIQHVAQDVHTHISTMEYRAGTPEGQSFYEDMVHLFHVARPYLSKWTKLPTVYDDFYRQMCIDLQQPDFCATWPLVTVWGTKPAKN